MQDLALGLSRMGRAYSPLATLDGTGATCVEVGMCYVGWSKYGALAFTADDPRIEPCPTTGCWLWTGSVSGSTGYGEGLMTSVDGGKAVRVLAHRAVWWKVVGAIPDGMFLDHMCRVRSCVNPDHLRVVTPRDNVLFNSLSIPALAMARVVCGRCGGEYTQYRRQRVCRACNNEAGRKRLANRRALGLCVFCGGPKETAKTGCRACLKYEAEKAARRKIAKAH